MGDTVPPFAAVKHKKQQRDAFSIASRGKEKL